MSNHRPASSAHGVNRGRHRRPRPSLQKLIYDLLIDRTPPRLLPAREITLRARRTERAAREGGRNA